MNTEEIKQLDNNIDATKYKLVKIIFALAVQTLSLVIFTIVDWRLGIGLFLVMFGSNITYSVNKELTK